LLVQPCSGRDDSVPPSFPTHFLETLFTATQSINIPLSKIKLSLQNSPINIVSLSSGSHSTAKQWSLFKRAEQLLSACQLSTHMEALEWEMAVWENQCVAAMEYTVISSHVYLLRLSVATEFQRKGIGSMMIQR
jgi:hypothetical protein